MAPFIFGKRGNIHIIDVKQTLKGVLIAKKLLADVVASGQDVVFVGTKRQAQKAVQEAASKCQMHHVSERWLGGMLTNFRTVRSRLQRLEELEAMAQDGSLERESKKQASRLKREMRKIRTNLDGVRKMTRLPGLVVAVDAKKEYLVLREAKKLGIPTVGVLDTDSDPDTVDVVIPANDDSIRAIELILNELSEAVAVGKTLAATRPQTVTLPPQKRGRPRRYMARGGQEAGPGQEAIADQQAPEAETAAEAEPEAPPPAPADGA